MITRYHIRIHPPPAKHQRFVIWFFFKRRERNLVSPHVLSSSSGRPLSGTVKFLWLFNVFNFCFQIIQRDLPKCHGTSLANCIQRTVLCLSANRGSHWCSLGLIISCWIIGNSPLMNVLEIWIKIRKFFSIKQHFEDSSIKISVLQENT